MKPVPLFLRAMDSRRSHLARLVASRCLAARRFPLLPPGAGPIHSVRPTLVMPLLKRSIHNHPFSSRWCCAASSESKRIQIEVLAKFLEFLGPRSNCTIVAKSSTCLCTQCMSKVFSG